MSEGSNTAGLRSLAEATEAFMSEGSNTAGLRLLADVTETFNSAKYSKLCSKLA